ncbi:MAG: hypothetical protein GQE15_39145 [Archangiaceae bacterium]|nr:hypothetical protein [Archangiaceae bacterium]
MRAFALTLLFAATATAAPIHELGPPTTKAIKALLDKGLELQAGDNTYSFKKKGVVSATGPDVAVGQGSYTLKDNRVTAKGSGTQKCMGEADACAGLGTLQWSFDIDFVVLAASETGLLIRVESASTSMLEVPRHPMVVGDESGEGDVVVNLVPASKDEKLADATWALIDGWKDDKLLFILGPQATKPRTVSEIFFGPKSEADAKTVAKKLEPVLGPITVKPWPGQTPFQVVVVIGDTRAK